MTERNDCDTRQKIEVSAAINIKKLCAFSALKHHCRRSEDRHERAVRLGAGIESVS
jgi:hypothetical protein